MKTAKKKCEPAMTASQLIKRIKAYAITRWTLYFAIIVALFWGGGYLLNLTSELNHRTAHAVCIEKMEQLDCTKYNVYTDYILVCREDNGKVFDLTVTPATYATTKKGDRVSFSNVSLEKLGESDKEVHYSRLTLPMWVLAIIMLIAIAVLYEWLNAEDIRSKGWDRLPWQEKQAFNKWERSKEDDD